MTGFGRGLTLDVDSFREEFGRETEPCDVLAELLDEVLSVDRV